MNIFNAIEKKICVEIPLTATSGKIRIKHRSILNDYGVPVATRKTPFSQNDYGFLQKERENSSRNASALWNAQ